MHLNHQICSLSFGPSVLWHLKASMWLHTPWAMELRSLSALETWLGSVVELSCLYSRRYQVGVEEGTACFSFPAVRAILLPYSETVLESSAQRSIYQGLFNSFFGGVFLRFVELDCLHAERWQVWVKTAGPYSSYEKVVSWDKKGKVEI